MTTDESIRGRPTHVPPLFFKLYLDCDKHQCQNYDNY
jgi:hypothetical protein